MKKTLLCRDCTLGCLQVPRTCRPSMEVRTQAGDRGARRFARRGVKEDAPALLLFELPAMLEQRLEREARSCHRRTITTRCGDGKGLFLLHVTNGYGQPDHVAPFGHIVLGQRVLDVHVNVRQNVVAEVDVGGL